MFGILRPLYRTSIRHKIVRSLGRMDVLSQSSPSHALGGFRKSSYSNSEYIFPSTHRWTYLVFALFLLSRWPPRKSSQGVGGVRSLYERQEERTYTDAPTHESWFGCRHCSFGSLASISPLRRPTARREITSYPRALTECWALQHRRFSESRISFPMRRQSK